MGIPKLKGFLKKNSNKSNETRLKLVDQQQTDSRDEILKKRKAHNLQDKAEITAYQDAINKTLDDTEMAKKAAMLLLEMIEGR